MSRAGAETRGSVVGLISALVLIAAGCAGVTEGSETRPDPSPADLDNVAIDGLETPQEGGDLVVGPSGSAAGWDPTGALFGYSSQMVALTFLDRLMTYDENSRPASSVAESVMPSYDFQTGTIVIRPNIVFSNGERLDAEAVRLNLEAHRASAITGATIGPIDEVGGGDR